MSPRFGRSPTKAEQANGGSAASREGRRNDAIPGAHSLSCQSLAHPPTLLVVENDEGDFMLLKRALYKVGATARVWWSRDAEEALSILAELEQSTSPICVVIEVRLGTRDGWGLVAEIKRKPHLRPVRCPLLTGIGDDKTRRRAKAEGIDAFYVKPCDAEGLAQIARELQKLTVG